LDTPVVIGPSFFVITMTCWPSPRGGRPFATRGALSLLTLLVVERAVGIGAHFAHDPEGSGIAGDEGEVAVGLEDESGGAVEFGVSFVIPV
jgi:hypothetical protein